MSPKCPIIGPKCEIFDCTGRTCQSRFPGLKVEWPELKGVSAVLAKTIIEKDNPHVTAFILPAGAYFVPAINCCNRVMLWVSSDNCPNGPVTNLPMVG
ncbi:unnamed protein product [Cochlearia groenlandica]